jgi:hypothetical protein
MTEARRSALRRIMTIAWDLYRTGQRSFDSRSFADCLKGAWTLTRKIAEASRGWKQRGHLKLSADLIKSPIARHEGRNSQSDFRAAYLTARIGY